MTQSDTQEARANRGGHPCPPWCTADHDQLVIAGKPEHGYDNVHESDPMTGAHTKVRLMLFPVTGKAEVAVSAGEFPGRVTVYLPLREAERLAALGVAIGGEMDQVGIEIMAAVAIAREAR